MTITNKYIHRKVAQTSAKTCEVCAKLSTSVLITEDKQDFFYVCPQHLQDPHFCSADQSVLEAAREREKKRLILDAEERLRKKKKPEPNPSDSKDGPDAVISSDKKPEKAAQDGGPSDQTGKTAGEADDGKVQDAGQDPSSTDDEPRIFNLKATFFNIRLGKKRHVEIARRTRERMTQPNLLPSVPRGLPGP